MHTLLYTGKESRRPFIAVIRSSVVQFLISISNSIPPPLARMQAFHSAYDAQLLMDSVPPDKRIPHTDR